MRSPAPRAPANDDFADQREADAHRYVKVLDKLIEVGLSIMSAEKAAQSSQTEAILNRLAREIRLARALRRRIMLERG